MALSKVDDLYSTLLEAAVDGIITIDEQGVITSFNSSAERLFGYGREEVIGEKVNHLMPAAIAREHDGYINNYMEGGEAKIIGIGREVEGKHKDGSVFPMHLAVGEAMHEGARSFIGICHDLTHYHQALRQLEAAEERYRDIVESQKQLICRVDSKLRITFVNASFSQVIGIQQDNLLGVELTDIALDGEHQLASRLCKMFQQNSDLDEVNITVTMRSRGDGALVDWSFKRVEGARKDQPIELQGLGIDVSDKEAALQHALYLENYDLLTGFLNKRAFSGALKPWISSRYTYALMHLDSKRFTLINQKYGYTVGDEVLAETAARINRTLDRPCLCAREGGSGILIALPVRNHADAHGMARRLVEALEQPIAIDGDSIRLDTACGIALYPGNSDQPETLIQIAASALQYAKTHDQAVAFFSPQFHAGVSWQLDIEQGLKHALDCQSLEIYLQPKLCLASHRIDSYEALVRWNHPEHGLIPPADFIPIAERTTLGQKLDRYMLAEVVKLIAKCREQGLETPVIAVNMTAKHFSDTTLPVFIKELLNTHNVPGHKLQLEITEGIVMKMRKTTTRLLDELRGLGIQISLDDFGTGYSSLSYLQQLPVDELKIDKIFVDDLTSTRGATLMRSIIAIGKASGLRIIAEGIEEEEQAQVLCSMNCDMGQGYFFAKPKPCYQMLGLSAGFSH
ncbi:putative bifunctional diguanylate cyclase/phosphodiesterase [Marinobacter fonticola]|uniref:putative bifunctional diguanylate cyclase/phosphodiesterase n=1 Tax=Marinobacter fonticola TaxID=2603215 RepID=UPI0011E74122|nr:EAL domain-containing protein [Marinobacter fonticola]